MPAYVQIIISALVGIITIGGAVWQNALGNMATQWVVLAVGLVMLFGMWIFPEARGGRGKE